MREEREIGKKGGKKGAVGGAFRFPHTQKVVFASLLSRELLSERSKT